MLDSHGGHEYVLAELDIHKLAVDERYAIDK